MNSYALLSVYDKTGLEEFAKELTAKGYRLLSTGGTAQFLQERGFTVTPVEEITGFPEIFHGRVKTLHPKIFGGVLYRRGTDDAVREEQEIPSIDLVVVNFYPFEKVWEEGKLTPDEMIEFIDIGGPSMVRAAAKNHRWVTIITDPTDYPGFLGLKDEEEAKGFRKKMALKAFLTTGFYDSLIARYLADGEEIDLPYFLLGGRRHQELRYGENPHQKAALFSVPPHSYIQGLQQLQGKELSYNNIKDLYETMALVADYPPPRPFCAITKHNNACGAALADTVSAAYRLALEGDPLSAYGGIIGFNVEVDEETAAEITKSFYEVIAAPAFSKEALALLATKKNLRVILQKRPPHRDLNLTLLDGGFLLQEQDNSLWRDQKPRYEQVAGPSLPEERIKDLLFAWTIVKHLKSNAICIVNNERIVAIGTGFTSRVDAVRFAVDRVKDSPALKGSVLASEAFFPFSDSIEVAFQAGVSAVIQPGGSIRDKEVIARCEELSIPLFLTHIRHFKH